MNVPSVLVDTNNFSQLQPVICALISKADFIGTDFETHDDRRHPGLDERCGYDPVTRKKGGGKQKPLIFDFRRTDICGMSFYSENMDAAYYLNVGHADAENRLSHDQLRSVLAAKRPESYWVAHNAPFEITVAKACLGVDLDQIICTLQMAVSTYSPDEYDHQKWIEIGTGGIEKLIPALVRAAETGLDPTDMSMSPALSELVMKVIAKESDAEWSYNGLTKSIAWGYGLKKAIKSHFGYDMQTFAKTLGDRPHMGQLTGAEAVAYGTDDAYWAIRLFRKLMTMLVERGGLQTFLVQENPMAKVFADLKLGGLRVDIAAIEARQHVERIDAAAILRKLRAAVRELLPFPAELNANLLEYDAWYQKGGAKYRKQIETWAARADAADDIVELSHARCATANKWMAELGKPAPVGPNWAHYMPIRTLLYDLIGTKPLVAQGKIEGDGEARGKLLIRLKDNAAAVAAIEQLNALASVDQRVKLYIAPYRQLTDPETGFLYPTVSSMLAARRMASQDPNGMQLAKRGQSVFVRGYFLPDNEYHVVVSADWSGIELVEIGEFSGDPKFIEAYGQHPHQDLHSWAAAQVLSIEVPGLDVISFKKLRAHTTWGDYQDDTGLKEIDRLMANLKGEPLLPQKAYSYWRTEAGKNANFNYFYSGWLTTIGERMGWSQDTTKQATDAYRNLFPIAEAWRVGLIEEVQREGYVTLPDGQRYTRYEATALWYEEWINKFVTPELTNYNHVIRWMGRKIAKRGGNQAVNAYIQGTCATIAKRSILRILDLIRQRQWDARFMMPIHDELVFSVHREIVPLFVRETRNIMLDHPDLFTKCKLDASPSIGLTFEPWNSKSARIGQCELFEPPAEIVGTERENTRLGDPGVKDVVDWLFEERKRQRVQNL